MLEQILVRVKWILRQEYSSWAYFMQRLVAGLDGAQLQIQNWQERGFV